MKELIIYFPLIPIFSSFVFLIFQNRKERLGGSISIPKSFWLSQAIFVWFFLPIIFFLTETNPLIKIILFIHLVSWWTRGAIEAFMIFKYFNWSPIYGIVHDLTHLVFLLAGVIFLSFFSEYKTITSANLFIIILTMATAFESYFAYIFLKIRGTKKHKIYYANNEPKWKKVNQVTIFSNIMVYSFIIYNSILVFNS